MTPTIVQPSPEGVPGAVEDPTGLAAEELTFAGADGTQVNGYLAHPSDSGPARPRRPAMIVIHEATGLNAHVRDVANRLANLGYTALGVDLYTREGGPPPLGDMQAVMERLFAMSDQTVLGDLEAGADLLRAREDASGKVGCIGFCMGGRYALLFAGASDRLDAAVDCWGGFIDRATPEERSIPTRPTPPLELAERLHCPLLAAVGVALAVGFEQADALAPGRLGPDLGGDRRHRTLVGLVRPIDVEEFQPHPLRRRIVARGLAHREDVEQRLRPAIGVERAKRDQRVQIVPVGEALLAGAVGRRRRGVDQPPLPVGAPAEEVARQAEIGLDDLVGVRLGGRGDGASALAA